MVGASGPAPRHSPRTTGWPGVSITSAWSPALRIWPASQSAALRVSLLCSERALTEGILRKSNSSSRKRPRSASTNSRTAVTGSSDEAADAPAVDPRHDDREEDRAPETTGAERRRNRVPEVEETHAQHSPHEGA